MSELVAEVIDRQSHAAVRTGRRPSMSLPVDVLMTVRALAALIDKPPDALPMMKPGRPPIITPTTPPRPNACHCAGLGAPGPSVDDLGHSARGLNPAARTRLSCSMIWFVTTLAVLDRPLYAVTEAARLLELPAATLRNWLDGFTVRGVDYPAVIRLERTGSPEVTWAEFVEAGYLREYRVQRVSLQKLRRFIDLARRNWDVPYPLAHFKPLVDRPPHELLVLLKSLQDEAELPDELQPVHLLDPATGQLVFRAPFLEFLDKVSFSKPEGIATSIHPLGERFPVVIDPDMSFGIPQVHGIRTETVAEAIATGEAEDDVATAYGLTIDDVHAAIQWELRLRPRKAAA